MSGQDNANGRYGHLYVVIDDWVRSEVYSETADSELARTIGDRVRTTCAAGLSPMIEDLAVRLAVQHLQNSGTEGTSTV